MTVNLKHALKILNISKFNPITDYESELNIIENQYKTICSELSIKNDSNVSMLNEYQKRISAYQILIEEKSKYTTCSICNKAFRDHHTHCSNCNTIMDFVTIQVNNDPEIPYYICESCGYNFSL